MRARRNLPLVLGLILSAVGNGQEPCGSDAYRQQLYNEFPWMETAAQTRDLMFQNFLASGGGGEDGGLFVVPVVVHVLWNTPAQNISDAQILSQIAVLNRDFRKLNANAGGTNWGLLAADSSIEFSLATRDPGGATTDGIVRVQTAVAGFTMPGNNMKFAASGGSNAWNRDQYLNIWVCNLTDFLGFAQFPQGPANTDGIVVRHSAFGTTGTATAPFHLGKTATHEAGHWLDLRHLWDVAIPFSLCRDDFMIDTPPQQGPIFGCPTNPTTCCFTPTFVNPCGSPLNPNFFAMVENYMGYADDACMSLFTFAQADRMQYILDASQSGPRAVINNSPGLPNRCAFWNASNLTDGFTTDTNVRCGFAVAVAAGRWNIAYKGSVGDWDLYIGQALSSFNGDAADFLVVNGHNGPINESVGAAIEGVASPVAPCRIGQIVASPIAVGSTTSGSIPQGRSLAAYEFQVSSPGSYVVTVSGDPTLVWDLYDSGTDARWRPRGAPHSGSVAAGSSTVNLAAGWHCLVVFDDTAWAQVTVSFQVCINTLCGGVSVGSGSPATPSPPAGTTPFGITPQSGRWNVVGVGSATDDFNLTIGTAASTYGGTTVDFAVANGHLGAVTPSIGSVTRVSGTGPATIQHASTQVGGANTYFIDTGLSAGRVIAAHEFLITAGGTIYNLAVTGDASLFWDLYEPGPDSAWRPRGAPYFGAVNGPLQTIYLNPGWHCLVIARDVGPASQDLPYRIALAQSLQTIVSQGNPVYTGVVGPVSQPLPLVFWPIASGFAFTAESNRWNVLAVRGYAGADSNLRIGGATPQSPNPNDIEIAVANGRFAPIVQDTGLLEVLGSHAPYIQHPNTGTAAIGSPLSATFPAGHLVVPYEFQITTFGSYSISVSGDASLSWNLYAPGTDNSWRGRGVTVQSGISNGAFQPQLLSAGWYCLLLIKDGGAPVSPIPFQICISANCSWTNLENGATASTGSPTVGSTVVSTNQTPGLWNIFGVGSPTADWNLDIGGVISNGSGTDTDFVIANGHLGGITPTVGTVTRSSGTAAATISHQSASGFSADLGQVVEVSIPAGDLFRMHEFEVATTGDYVVSLTGTPGLIWDLYTPGTGPGWRPRGASVYGGAGGPVQTVNLSPGWHAIVLVKDGPLINAVASYRLVVARAPGVILDGVSASATGTGSYGFLPGAGAFTFAPVASRWNAVGIRSDGLSDFDLHLGAAHSQLASVALADFVVANGRLGAIPETTGVWVRNSDANSMLQHVAAAPFALGTTVSGSLAAGQLLAIHEVEVTTPGTYSLTVTGNPALTWDLYDPLTSSAWNPRGAPWSGSVGTPESNLSLYAGWHCIVVLKDGAAGATNLDYQINLCPVAAPVSLVAGGITTVGTVANCAPFSLTPTGALWHGVAVLGTTPNWDLRIGTTTSQLPNSQQVDFLLANGALGAISPTTGLATRVSGGGSATLQHVTAQAAPVPGQLSSALNAGHILKLVQFQITSPAQYGINVTGNVALRWELYAPGTDASWRARGSLISGVVGGGQQAHFLGAGLHVLAVFADAFPSASNRNFVVQVSNPNPVPTLASLNPSSTTVGTSSVTLFCNGTGYVAGSVIKWNGAALTTTWLSNAQVRATLTSAMLATAGTAGVTVYSPPPAGGESAAQTFTINNPLPVLSSMVPSSATAGGPQFNIVLTGSEFQGNSVIRWNGANLSTAPISSSQLQATIGSALIAVSGTATVTVFTPGPGGGLSPGLTFMILNPGPVITSLSPASVVAGSGTQTLTVNGSGFLPLSIVQWNTDSGPVSLMTNYVSASQLTAVIAATLLNLPTTQTTVYVVNPAGGGQASMGLVINGPTIIVLNPPTTPVMGPASTPVTITLTANSTLPSSFVLANGDPLATTFAGQFLTAILPPSILQTQRPGGIVFSIQNGSLYPRAISNHVVLEVGGNFENGASIRRDPLNPAPGAAYSVLVEGGVANALLTLVVDSGNPPPLTNFPTAAANQVIAVTPAAGSTGAFLPLVDGFGLFGPASGAALDPYGVFALPGFAVPNPLIGVSLTIQGVSLDPSALLGFRLTWARYPERL